MDIYGVTAVGQAQSLGPGCQHTTAPRMALTCDRVGAPARARMISCGNVAKAPRGLRAGRGSGHGGGVLSRALWLRAARGPPALRHVGGWIPLRSAGAVSTGVPEVDRASRFRACWPGVNLHRAELSPSPSELATGQDADGVLGKQRAGCRRGEVCPDCSQWGSCRGQNPRVLWRWTLGGSSLPWDVAHGTHRDQRDPCSGHWWPQTMFVLLSGSRCPATPRGFSAGLEPRGAPGPLAIGGGGLQLAVRVDSQPRGGPEQAEGGSLPALGGAWGLTLGPLPELATAALPLPGL